jgi:predicted metal-dependent phosphotriesterase family hydrolase
VTTIDGAPLEQRPNPADDDAPSRQVITVRGPVAPENLGVTLSHDHVILDAFSLWGETTGNYGWILDDVDVATREVAAFGAAGGGAICEPTNVGIGRNPLALRSVSEQTGVHIVMGSGWYRERCYPRYIYEEMPDRLAERLVRELAFGADDTGVRAGFIGEIGTERGSISPAQERVFRAAARAHAQTGCPILTHTTHFGELALEQLDLLESEGVSPRRVIVSHLGDRVGISSLLPIAARGAWLSVDNLGFISGYAPLEVRADNVAALVGEGLSGQVMLSNDICQVDQLAEFGGPGYMNVLTQFVPMLLERAVQEEAIQRMLVENPAQAFAYDAEGARRRYLQRSGASS